MIYRQLLLLLPYYYHRYFCYYYYHYSSYRHYYIVEATVTKQPIETLFIDETLPKLKLNPGILLTP